MASLFEKVRVAVLGNLHDLLDRKVNTPAGYKQYIRDLEVALADLRAAVDEAVGTGNGYRRDITHLESEKASKQADIDLLLGDDDPANDEAALQLQVEFEDVDSQIENRRALLAENDANAAALNDAVEKLEAKHREMVNNLDRLTVTQASAKAKSRAAAAAEAAAAASDSVDGVSVDSIEARINHENDVASARFDRVIGQLQSDDDPAQAARLARAKAALDARRAQIAGKAKEPQDA
jgi:phage shock protein A